MCKFKKALYGLKQAPHAWYKKIHAYLLTHSFQNSPTKSTLYVKCDNDVLLIVVVSVDDMLFIGPTKMHIASFKADLNVAFEMSNMGLLHHYFGIQFTQIDGVIHRHIVTVFWS